MGRRKTVSELEQAELRYRNLLEKRDRHNADARAVREERDLLNRKKKELLREIAGLRKKRSRLLKEVREHKETRNALQGRARELIQVKRQLRVELKGGVEGELTRRRERIREMESRQQTAALTLEQEERLLAELRRAHDDVAHLEAVEKEHRDVLRQVGEIDSAIDDLFQRAEGEHQLVLQGSEEAEKRRAEVEEREDGLSLLIAEADRIHDVYLSIRKKADHYHQRAMEMREKLVAIKHSRREEYEDALKIIRERKEKVKKALEDEEAVEEALDKALSTLRKGGRLEL